MTSLLIDLDGVVGGRMDCLSGDACPGAFLGIAGRDPSVVCDLSTCMRLMDGESISANAFRLRGVATNEAWLGLDVSLIGSGLDCTGGE